MVILVTGAAGYIGSHTVLALMEAGHEVIAIDNFINSHPLAWSRVGELAGRSFHRYESDLCDRAELEAIFGRHPIDAVIHFAGLKSVGESVRKPLAYYQNNLVSTLILLETMKERSVSRLVFSSSATVYGTPEKLPLVESAPLSAVNPYGRTKLMIEDILRDLAHAEPTWHIALLRYFNPVGAHASGRIGEDPRGLPNNLFPYIAQVAVGKLPELSVFGNDYPTPDGTGVRDYIHVADLAEGHVRAVECLDRCSGAEAINLGTGRGYSVLEAIHAFERASGKRIPFRIMPRRPGDVAACYADASKARQLLHWQPRFDLPDMCRDHWRWQSQNPAGYET